MRKFYWEVHNEQVFSYNSISLDFFSSPYDYTRLTFHNFISKNFPQIFTLLSTAYLNETRRNATSVHSIIN